MPDPRRIVILGAGFAGAYCAQQLERSVRGDEAEVFVLDHHNYFVFTPLLVEAGTGSLEPRHAVVSIRRFLRRSTFISADVQDIDADRHEVWYRLVGETTRSSLRYDHLVIALGSVASLPDVPGLREYGFELNRLEHAAEVRDRAVQMLERAEGIADLQSRPDVLSFVVVGGNYTGVETAGELQDFLKRASRLYPSISPDSCRVSLVEIQDRILPALDADLASYAARQLRARDVELQLETSVARIREDSVELTTGGTLPSRTVIWCAGTAPPPLLTELPVPVDERGYVECERDCRVQGHERLWAIGDCALNPGPDGMPYPPTAQHAIREGKACARNIARALRRRPSRPCDITPIGNLSALGHRTGIATILGVKCAGFLAWFLWRTVYLFKMPGLSRKVRVALDWTLDLLFPCDSVGLGLHRSQRS